MRSPSKALSATALSVVTWAVPLAFLVGFVGADSPATHLPVAPIGEFYAPTHNATDTLSANGRRRAERLLENRVACLGCHALNGAGGAIGPTLDGVGERLSPEAIRSKIVDPQGSTPGSLMPAQPLAPREVTLLTNYLTDGVEWSGVESRTAAGEGATRPDAAALYQLHCSSCHGVEGQGDGWNATNLPVPPTAHADSTLMARRADDTLFDAIHAGGWVLDKSAMMPAFGEMLTREQIQGLVAHIRTLCDCSGPAWSRDGVGQSTGMAPLGR